MTSCDNGSMKPRNVLVSILLISSLGCNLPLLGSPIAPTETAIVIPTNAAGSPPATETATAALSTATASLENTAALEAILILSPGATSVVTSSVTVEGQSRPTFEQNLTVAVYDEGGALLAKVSTTIQAGAGSPGPFSAQLNFNVDHQQAGRISVFETSAKDDGIQHLSSVEITLSPTGPANIVPATIGFESIQIQSPLPLAVISGGSVTITGYSDYYFESNLGLKLCGEGGGGAHDDLCGTVDNVLGSGTAIISAPDVGQPGPFRGTLTWSVTQPVQGRIVVFAASPRDGGWLHVASIPVLIQP